MGRRQGGRSQALVCSGADPTTAQFWKGFFEASANVKLSDYYGTSDTASGVPHSDADDTTRQEMSEDQSDADTTVHGSRHGATRFAHGESPFETLQKDMRQNFGVDSSVQSNNKAPSNTSSTSTSLRRPHLSDLSFDSPDSIQAPHLEMMSLNDGLSRAEPDSPLSQHQASRVRGNAFQLDDSPDQAGHGKTPKSASGKLLRHQVLLKQMLGTERGPSASTPLKVAPPKEAFPPEVESGWNGIADLRKTNLADFDSPRKGKATPAAKGKSKSKGKQDSFLDDDSLGPRSPPEMVHYSVSRSKLARTPAKEAARLVARDVLETARLKAGYSNPMDLEDSPGIDPPSVVKNWATRGYDTLGAEGERKGFEEEAFNEDEDDEVPEDSFRFQASVQEELSKVVADDDEDLDAGAAGYSHLGDDGAPGVGDESEAGAFGRVVDDSYASHGGDASAVDESMGGPVNPEEETLFGVGRGQPSEAAADFEESLLDEDEAAPPGQHKQGQGRFSIMGRGEEMDTLHGGVLLESQPFEASPLQGRDWRGL